MSGKNKPGSMQRYNHSPQRACAVHQLACFFKSKQKTKNKMTVYARQYLSGSSCQATNTDSRNDCTQPRNSLVHNVS